MTDLVFVYGSLKQGHANFHVNRGRRIGDNFVTLQAYPLHVVGPRCLPCLLDRPGQGLPVVGQLFEVDAETLAAMDRLERIDDPRGYVRGRIGVRAHPAAPDAAPYEAFVYFGSVAGFGDLPVLAGPLAEYTSGVARAWPLGGDWRAA